MDDLEFDFTSAVAWFPHEQDQPYILVKISKQYAEKLPELMGIPLRRCYITDGALAHNAEHLGVSQRDVLRSRLPDSGATMAGDFGEVLCYFYRSTRELPANAIGPKKWRLKQDRTKPAPKSDVIHFVMPDRPNPSESDVIFCSEVKLKSKPGNSIPIASAIEGCEKDRVSRLAATLVWLKERAMTEDLGDVDIPLLNRFINANDNPPVSRRFSAVAVVCESLLEGELATAPSATSLDFSLIVISVPDLYRIYNETFAFADASVS